MEQIFIELVDHIDVRSNLSALRAAVREYRGSKHAIHSFIHENEELFWGFLENEDPKIRKNAAMLLKDVFYQKAAPVLYHAYKKEETLFVRSIYLDALKGMDIGEWVEELKEQNKKLYAGTYTREERKHVEAEIRSLNELIVSYEGIMEHPFVVEHVKNRVLLTADKNQRELVQAKAGGTVHPLGVLVETADLAEVMEERTHREILFPVPVKELLDPANAAAVIWKPVLAICKKYHEGEPPFYYRIECRPKKTLKEMSVFGKRLGAEIWKASAGMLINSTNNYEVELRLFADKSGKFFPALKFFNMPEKRFSYRKNTIDTSIHPSTAAQIMEIAAPYLKEGASILDPFCGVGTMLIERDLRVPAGKICGVDFYGMAIKGARENAKAAGEEIQFLQKNFFEYECRDRFDEIITNMPVRGSLTRDDMDWLYERFFKQATLHLKKTAVIIMHTNEMGFVKKQLRLHGEYTLLKEHCMQNKTGFYVLVIGVGK